jgi:hypothetical protein
MIGLAGIDAGMPDRFNTGITKFFSEGDLLTRIYQKEESGMLLISSILKVRS